MEKKNEKSNRGVNMSHQEKFLKIGEGQAASTARKKQK